MKIVKNTKHSDLKQSSVEYSLWPSEGTGKATLKEWENGEGYDLFLGDAHIELSHCEMYAIIALFGLRNCQLGE